MFSDELLATKDPCTEIIKEGKLSLYYSKLSQLPHQFIKLKVENERRLGHGLVYTSSSLFPFQFWVALILKRERNSSPKNRRGVKFVNEPFPFPLLHHPSHSVEGNANELHLVSFRPLRLFSYYDCASLLVFPSNYNRSVRLGQDTH